MKRHFQIPFFTLAVLCFFSTSLSAQFVNFEDTWQEFLSKDKVSGISKVTKPNKEDKHDYSKYCLMYATTNFCSSDIKSAENFMSEIRKVGEPVYSTIPGFQAKYDDLNTKIKAYHKVDYMWDNYLSYRNVSLSDLEEAANAKRVCEKGTLAKYFQMTAYAHYCNANIAETKDNFENRVLKLAERTSLEIKDIPGLEKEVKDMKLLFAGLKALGPAWKGYLETGVSKGFDTELPLVKCNPIPSMKAYVLKAAADLCGSGKEMLDQIKQLQANNPHELEANLKEKISWLEKEVGSNNDDLQVLNTAWQEFEQTDTLQNGIQFGYEYCEKEDEIRALVITGTVNACTQGEEMLKKIIEIQKEHQLQVAAGTLDKIKGLGRKLTVYKQSSENLNKVWGEFIANNDSLLSTPTLAHFYCNKIDQIKSWTLRGHLNSCQKGQQYLDRIDALQASESLELDEELNCRIQRLRIKVWDCRYWELVMQARKETHAERERFGPESSTIMQADLNGEELKCETTVEYNPLGNIGIKYVITTYLCQDIDLAKMGDPEYYKKIATWVDAQVLQKYCEESLRCKEDFFIYLEGHTDGNAFRGARYKSSLGIPEATAFTHFVDGEVIEKETEREITTSLKSNMELGIARAWTVKNQLDFMEVPIKIGAYEHPSSEKGGEYRSVQIELNITNLLLDFYEKRLGELLLASGIGERPDEC